MKTRAERDAVRAIANTNAVRAAIGGLDIRLFALLDAADELERERDEEREVKRQACNRVLDLEAQLALADELAKAVELMSTAPIAGSVRVTVTGNAYLEARRGTNETK